VNNTLASGTPPGNPLFTYDTVNGANVAASLRVAAGFTSSDLVTTDANGVSNGVPLALSQLANPQSDQFKIQPDGSTQMESYTEFYGDMASRVGSALSDATNHQTVQQSAVSQAQNLRQQVSGVDLNEEAMILVQFQSAYEANSKLITVLDQLTQDTINILQ
jgi:flagellar hook-associated protein 1 FlgK